MLLVRPRARRVLVLPGIALSAGGLFALALVRSLQGSGPWSSPGHLAIGSVVAFVTLGYAAHNARWFCRRGDRITWGGLTCRGQQPSKGARLQGKVLTGGRVSYLEIWLAASGQPTVRIHSTVYNQKADARARRIAEALGIRWQRPSQSPRGEGPS